MISKKKVPDTWKKEIEKGLNPRCGAYTDE